MLRKGKKKRNEREGRGYEGICVAFSAVVRLPFKTCSGCVWRDRRGGEGRREGVGREGQPDGTTIREKTGMELREGDAKGSEGRRDKEQKQLGVKNEGKRRNS